MGSYLLLLPFTVMILDSVNWISVFDAILHLDIARETPATGTKEKYYVVYGSLRVHKCKRRKSPNLEGVSVQQYDSSFDETDAILPQFGGVRTECTLHGAMKEDAYMKMECVMCACVCACDNSTYRCFLSCGEISYSIARLAWRSSTVSLACTG